MNSPGGFLRISRFFHATSTLSDSLSRSGRNMNKLIKGSNRLKKKWYNPNFAPKEIFPTVKSIVDTRGQFGKVANRRVTVLNKLFMRHITDQMSTGEIASKLYGRAIEISKIRITSDFQTVNIYWLARGTPDDEKTETVLNEIAGLLRHELSQLRLMGNIPKIYFIKDKQMAKVMEVEMQLAKADFGEDHTPIDRSYLLKSEFMLNSKLDPQIKEKIMSAESLEEMDEIVLPVKSEAIFGLDREMIVKRITASVKKSKDAWAGNNGQIPDLDEGMRTLSESSGLYSVDTPDRNAQLKEFLRLRKIAKKNAERIPCNSLKVSENEDSDSYENETLYPLEEFEDLEDSFEENLNCGVETPQGSLR